MLRILPSALTHSFLRHTPIYIPTSNVRTYTKKKEKVLSFKKQQQKKREQARAQAKQAEERKLEKERERIEKQAEKFKERTIGGQEKPKIPKPFISHQKHIPLKHDKANRADEYRDFINTHQNIDFDLEPGMFGRPELRTVEDFTKWIADNRNTIEELMVRAENGEDVFDQIDSKIQLIRSITALIANLHDDPTWITAATTSRESFETWINRYTQNNTLLEKRKALDKIPVEEELTTFKESADVIRTREILQDHVNNSKIVKVQGWGTIYELPPHIHEEIPRSHQKKKKFRDVDLTTHAEPVLTYVSNERVRKQIREAIQQVIADSNKNQNLDQLLQELARQSNKLAKVAFNKDNFAHVLAKNFDLEVVTNVLNTMRNTLKAPAEKEASQMLAIKKSRFQDSAWRKTAFEAGFKLPLGEKPEININDLKIEPMDILHYSRASLLHNTSTYPPNKIQEFFPISRCIEGLNLLAKSLFKAELRPAKRGEGGYPELKRLQVVREGQVIGDLYLDLFRRPQKPVVLSYINTEPRSAVLSLNLDENLLGKPSLLNMHELSEFMGQAGVALTFITSGNMLSGLSERVVADVFARLCHEKDFLLSFAKHKGTNQVLLNEYLAQFLIQNPYFGNSVKLISDVAYAQYELLLFKDLEGLSWLQSQFSEGTLIVPNLQVFSQIGDVTSPLYEPLFSRLIAAQVYRHNSQPEKLGATLQRRNLTEMTQGIPNIFNVEQMLPNVYPKI
jgi:hypothetical protein